VLDGATFTLPPTSELRRVFPPAVNQQGETVWPLVLLTRLLLTAHELQTGCALIPELGARYGPDNTSEAAWAVQFAHRIPSGSLVLADANFGIFAVVWGLHRAGHDFLCRLTAARFRCLTRGQTPDRQTPGETTWRVSSRSSAKERKSHPDLPAAAVLEMRVHDVLLDNGEHLHLVTNLP